MKPRGGIPYAGHVHTLGGTLVSMLVWAFVSTLVKTFVCLYVQL